MGGGSGGGGGGGNGAWAEAVSRPDRQTKWLSHYRPAQRRAVVRGTGGRDGRDWWRLRLAGGETGSQRLFSPCDVSAEPPEVDGWSGRVSASRSLAAMLPYRSPS